MAKKSLTTARLFLREFSLSDASSFYALNGTPEVMLHTGDLPFASIEEARKFILNYDHYTLHGFGRWTIQRISDKKVLGWCGLKKHPSGMIDLGYRLHQEFWGQGYATEAAQACITYGLHDLNIKSIIGRTAAQNNGSIRVLEKIGMVFWKTAPCEGIENSIYYKIEQ